MQQRLEELEGMVSHICKAIDVDIESVSMAEFKTSTGEALKRLRPLSSPEASATESVSTRRTESLTTSESGNFFAPPDESDSFEDAPLLALFKDAMFIQRNDSQFDRERLQSHASRRVRSCIEALSSLLPNPEDLTEILTVTQPYWFIWPVSLASLDPKRPVTGVHSAREFILDSLNSGVPARAAKSVLWLALCIQQLSNDFMYRRQLPAPPNVLLDSYMSSADTLLSIGNEAEGTIEDLQCIMLHSKLYINMGKPRKAWLKIRHALNLAILLGIPNMKPGNEHSALWSQLWPVDRQLSLILGFPYGIAESHPALSKKFAGDNSLSRAMHDICIIAGHIVDRNQNAHDVDYSVTLQIEQELYTCRASMPQDFWNATPTTDMPLSQLYYRSVFKIYYYQSLKFLHLPYMLKSSTDKKFEHSRQVALESSREMMKSYRNLRGTGDSQIIMCDLLDFQAFSSALVMVIGLVSQSLGCIYQEAEDWGLIQSVIRQLQMVATGMDCSVAGQGAQLLENLSMAYSGTYSGPDGYEAVIPYFGKVRVGKLKRNESEAPLSVGSNETQLLATDTMDFNTISLVPFSQDSLFQSPFTDAELGVDWTSVFDVDNNYNYDWSQVFDYRGP